MTEREKKEKRRVARWLWTGAGLIFLMVIIGGITRLTGSGLSMTDWNLIMGTFPPTNKVEWQQAFDQYKQFPEYQKVNRGMSMDEFKAIFFWEYTHRLLGRIIGLVFIIPFLIFWRKGYFSTRWKKRMLLLLFLGALQGAIGWIMVKSGLVDVPYVSHYRLALHLLLAFTVFGFCVWYALDLQQDDRYSHPTQSFNFDIKRWTVAIFVIFFLQVTWGAFTAGLDAGLLYNTFPRMNGQWIPPYGGNFFRSLIENPGIVQWVHRITGTVLTLMVIGLWIKTQLNDGSVSVNRSVSTLMAVILAQYVIGVLTVLYQVPVALGVIHQGVALLFLTVWLLLAHKLYYQYEDKAIKKESKSLV